jgi:hypothetical protein
MPSWRSDRHALPRCCPGLAAGTVISAPVITRPDRARALADTWQHAEAGHQACTPYVYEVTAVDGGLLVLREVLISGERGR